MRPVRGLSPRFVPEHERAKKFYASHHAAHEGALPPARPSARARLECLEIGDRRAQAANVVLEMAEAEIAEAAEQSADQIGWVIMIDAQPLDRALVADRAHAILLFKQRVVLSGRDPVVIFQPGPAFRFRIVLALLAVGIGMLRPFAPPLGVDCVFVGGIEGAIAGKRAQSEVSILRIALLFALAFGRHGTASLNWRAAQNPRAPDRNCPARGTTPCAHARAAPQTVRPAEIVTRCLGWKAKAAAEEGPRQPGFDHTSGSCRNYTRIALHTQAQNVGKL